MSKKQKSAQQWKVVKGVQLSALERTCEEWTGKGWTVMFILGPFSEGLAVVLSRMLVL